MLQTIIVEALEKVLDKKVHLLKPAYPEFGDFAFNINALGKNLSSSDIEMLIEKIKTNPLFGKIELKGTFINLFINESLLEKEINVIVKKGSDYGKNKYLKDKKITIEFTDPNPFKEFHIGHLYSNTVGESISRILEWNGAQVRRVNYEGDVGLHVAKAIWGFRKKLKEENTTLAMIGEMPLVDRIRFLGQAYALGAQKYDEDGAIQAEIKSLNKEIYETIKTKGKSSPELFKLYSQGKNWSLDYFALIYQRLGTEFKKLYFESEVADRGYKIVKENLGTIFESSEGAIIFPGKKYGLHNRVFINSLDLPTYEAKELGLAVIKYSDSPYDQSIIITGNEINAYFKVLLKALELIKPDLAKKTKHLSHGMVRLKSGKMSSRTGKIITAESILDEAHKKAYELINQKTHLSIEGSIATSDSKAPVKGSKMWSTASIEEIGAVKYSLLKSTIGRDIEFDLEETVRFNGNSGPYLQYTYARIQSLFKNLKREETQTLTYHSYERSLIELSLLRKLIIFPDIVEEASRSYSPHTICSYLYELAQKFNFFYEKEPILKAENKVKESRLALSKAVGNVINNGLYMLGIQTADRI